MITITLHCPHCQSEALVRNGRAPNGKQKYLCRAAHSPQPGRSGPACLPEEHCEEIREGFMIRRSGVY